MSPSHNLCASNESLVRLDLKTDDHPGGTTWFLVNINDFKVIDMVGFGSEHTYQPESLYTHQWCLDSCYQNIYSFTIIDMARNHTSETEKVDAYYSLSVNGQVVKMNTKFNDSEDYTEFVLPCLSQIPSSVPSSSSNPTKTPSEKPSSAPSTHTSAPSSLPSPVLSGYVPCKEDNEVEYYISPNKKYTCLWLKQSKRKVISNHCQMSIENWMTNDKKENASKACFETCEPFKKIVFPDFTNTGKSVNKSISGSHADIKKKTKLMKSCRWLKKISNKKGDASQILTLILCNSYASQVCHVTCGTCPSF